MVIKEVLGDHSFVRWLIWRSELELTPGNINQKLVSVEINPFDLPSKARLVFSTFVKDVLRDGVAYSVTIGKRSGHHAFVVVNMAKHKHNRKPTFIKIGTDQDIIDFFTEYKLANT